MQAFNPQLQCYVGLKRDMSTLHVVADISLLARVLRRSVLSRLCHCLVLRQRVQVARSVSAP